jgi:hypothetical protein
VLPEENYSRPKPALRRAWENGIYHYTEAWRDHEGPTDSDNGKPLPPSIVGKWEKAELLEPQRAIALGKGSPIGAVPTGRECFQQPKPQPGGDSSFLLPSPLWSFSLIKSGQKLNDKGTKAVHTVVLASWPGKTRPGKNVQQCLSPFVLLSYNTWAWVPYTKQAQAFTVPGWEAQEPVTGIWWGPLCCITA